jgi:hypothetical protein
MVREQAIEQMERFSSQIKPRLPAATVPVAARL